MKILHISMWRYSDGWTYQDNLLTKYHKRLGHDVVLLTSEYCFKEGTEVKDEKTDFVDVNGIRVHRLQRKKSPFSGKLPVFRGMREAIEREAPDVIFSHGCQYRDLRTVVRYVKKHPSVRLIVDSHADFSNSATNFLSKHVLHRIIWRHYARMAVPHAEVFWGVLPARVEFLQKMYGIPAGKTALLVMGADNDQVGVAAEKRIPLRAQWGVGEKDFVVMTGGKIDSAKRQTLTLMRAVGEMDDPRVKLFVFGSVEPALQKELNALCNDRVRYLGWIKPDDTYGYFAAADLVVFPGRHSVFWEQVAGMGIPLIVKHWQGTTHVDCGGNARFLANDSLDEMHRVLREAMQGYDAMQQAAKQAAEQFSYEYIAVRSLSHGKHNDAAEV